MITQLGQSFVLTLLLFSTRVIYYLNQVGLFFWYIFLFPIVMFVCLFGFYLLF